MLLDLGLRGAAVSIKPTHGAWTLDFPAFLELYSHQCGLSIAGKSNRQDGIWIPTASGIWEEVMTHALFQSDYLFVYVLTWEPTRKVLCSTQRDGMGGGTASIVRHHLFISQFSSILHQSTV